jgi:hypothetical protein
MSVSYNIIRNIDAFYNIFLKKLNDLDYNGLITAIRTIITRTSKNGMIESNRMNQIFKPFIEELEKHVYNENQKKAIAFFLSRLLYLPQLNDTYFSKTNILETNLEKMNQLGATNINFDRNFTDSKLKFLVNSIIKNPIYSENKRMLFYLVLTFIKKFME